jgi:H+/gluconate symporter-like permease
MLAPIGIILGIVILVYLAMKGVNIVIIAPLAALVIIFTNGMSLQEAFFLGKTSYLFGLGGFIGAFLPIFMLGAILGKYLEDSKATITIANSIFKLTGRDNAYTVLLAIALISAILTYGGVSLFIVIFTIVALARPIFKELNLPWHLVMVPMIFGGTTFTMTMVPGTPSIQNVIPTQLGTTLTAAPLLSIAATIVSIMFGIVYMKWELNKAITSGKHYEEGGQIIETEVNPKQIPSLFLSILPMVVLIGIIFIGSAMKISNIIVPALLTAVIVAAIGLNKWIPNQLKTLNTGAINSLLPIIFTAAAVGVGSVVASAPGFNTIQEILSTIPGGTLMQIPIITGFLAMVTASASGALGIVIPLFGQTWVASGVDPEVVHRIAAMASSTFAAMPQSGFIFSCMAVFGLTHKEVYKQVFFLGLVGGILCMIVTMILAIIIY